MTNVLEAQWRGKTRKQKYTKLKRDREKKYESRSIGKHFEQMGFESIFKTIYTWNTANILWQLIPQIRSSMCKRPIPP